MSDNQMSYYQRIQKAVDFIEDNLASNFSLQDVSKQAYFSLYHFHRLFHSMTGLTLKAYIRKRRLAEAAKQLSSTKARIIDLAYRYHYQTPESFSRAFKSEFGCSPSAYRKNNVVVDYFRPYSNHEQLSVKGDVIMEPVIKTIPSFKVVGYVLQTTTVDERNVKEIPEFWTQILADDCAELKRIQDVVHPHISYGICTDLQDDASFSYIIGYEVSTFDNAAADMHCVTIPEAKYAVFTAKGPFPESIQKTTRFAYGQWLPESNYELAKTADLEIYDETRMNTPDGPECDICIPIV